MSSETGSMGSGRPWEGFWIFNCDTKIWRKEFEPWRLIYVFKIQLLLLSGDSLLGRQACRQICKKVTTAGQTQDNSGLDQCGGWHERAEMWLYGFDLRGKRSN